MAEGSGRLLEFAKSGRAACKGKCKNTLEKGSLRYGVLSQINDHDAWQWRCLACITSKVAANAVEACGGDLSTGLNFDAAVPEETKTAFMAYLTALAGGDADQAATQLQKMTGVAAPAAEKSGKAKADKPKRPVEDILKDGRADGFSTLTIDDLKELLKAKKAKVSGKKDDLVERVEEVYGGGDDDDDVE